jgi:type I site-specific restriction-modification system R (restriction) subunit
MLQPANLLDILRNFTLFKTSGGRTIKLVPRYQQYRTVHEAIGPTSTTSANPKQTALPCPSFTKA